MPSEKNVTISIMFQLNRLSKLPIITLVHQLEEMSKFIVKLKLLQKPLFNGLTTEVSPRGSFNEETRKLTRVTQIYT